MAAKRPTVVCNLAFALGALALAVRSGNRSGSVRIGVETDEEVDRVYGELIACVDGVRDREHCRPPEMREHTSGSTAQETFAWRRAEVWIDGVEVVISGPHRAGPRVAP